MLIYGCTLRLNPACDRHLVAGIVANWLRYKTRSKVTADDLLRSADLSVREGSVTTALATDHQPELWALRYEHGDSSVSGRQWVTDICTRRTVSKDLFECTVFVRTNEVSARVAAPVTVSRPTVVRDLADACGVSRTPGLKLHQLTLDDAAAFSYGLEDERRGHAYVLVSPTTDGKYLLHVEQAKSLLVGLADVVVIPADVDTFLLQRILGRRFSVWGGAVNIIFPSTRFQGVPFVPTRRLMPDDLTQLVEKGVRVETEILSILTHRTNLPMLVARNHG